jgi:threonylcarbamoyladenosine tRNA methylthiotransferase MtaB
MSTTGRISFQTLGCKLNFSETSTLARQFAEAGYSRVEMEDAPDVLVINTCSVTEQADKKCRNIVSRAVRSNPNVFVAVVGCYAQLKPQEIAEIPGVNLVLGAGQKFNLVEHVRIQKEQLEPAIHVGEIKDVKDFIPSFSAGDRTRTFLKVQDGCNYFCAFCTIPLARGRSRSATIEETVVQAKKAIEAGAKEIVLTGVNIGDYGTQHNTNLLALVKELDSLKGVQRYRISSIEPNLLSNEIIDFVAASNKFMPHFHIPLQSGSDDVLQLMRRRYRTNLYRERVERILTAMPNACIGIDVITGFPGETDERFEETRQFLLEIPAAYFHVFTYSERDNTTALRIGDVVPMEKRHRRTLELRLLSDKKKRAFYEKFTGTTHRVLWEASEDEGLMHGFTENYLKVSQPWDVTNVNQISEVRLNNITSEIVFSTSPD